MSVWSRRARWHGWTPFDVETLAKILGRQPGTIYQYISRQVEGFPKPTETGSRNYWSAQDVFDLILRSYPQRSHLVPRLYPRVAEPNPAVFLFAERVLHPRYGAFGVHAWAPSDGAPPIAVAYPADGVTNPEAPHAASDLLARLQWASLVAVPNGESTFIRGEDGDQPLLSIADRQPDAFYRDPTEYGTARASWCDLANLLRVDIPWWTTPLSDVDAIVGWRPGAPTQRLMPKSGRTNPRRLLALAVPDDPDPVHDALEHLAAQLRYQLCTGLDRQSGYGWARVEPGLIHGAVPAIDLSAEPPPLTVAEVAAVLHNVVPNVAAAHAALATLNVTSLQPLLVTSMSTGPDARVSMAREWMSNLVDVPEARRNELGFVKTAVDSNVEQPVRWLTDRRNADTWVVVDPEGTWHFGVGTRATKALGALQEAEIDSHAAFFRDGAGQVWPIPANGYDDYQIGYRGSGPHALADTLALLHTEANADVASFAYERSEIINSPLYKLLTTRDAPMTLSPGTPWPPQVASKRAEP